MKAHRTGKPAARKVARKPSTTSRGAKRAPAARHAKAAGRVRARSGARPSSRHAARPASHAATRTGTRATRASASPSRAGADPAREGAGAAGFRDDLLRFIHTEVLAEEARKRTIDAATPLFEDGLVNSIKILDLIAFVEKRLRTKIPDSQIIMKNFRSVQAITDTFARR